MMAEFRNTTGYFSAAFADSTVLIVNKDLKGDMEINGFEDLLNPELKGKIAFGNPVNSSSAFQSLMMLYGVALARAIVIHPEVLGSKGGNVWKNENGNHQT